MFRRKFKFAFIYSGIENYVKLWHTPIELPAAFSQSSHFISPKSEERSKDSKLKHFSADVSQKEREISCLLVCMKKAPEKTTKKHIEKIRSLGFCGVIDTRVSYFLAGLFFFHRSRHKEKNTWAQVFGVSRLKRAEAAHTRAR